MGKHVCFVIPIIVEIAGYRFEVYTLVSEIHENVDLVLGIKNMLELEGIFNLRECCFSFLNQSLPIFPKEKNNNETSRTEGSKDRSTIHG